MPSLDSMTSSARLTSAFGKWPVRGDAEAGRLGPLHDVLQLVRGIVLPSTMPELLAADAEVMGKLGPSALAKAFDIDHALAHVPAILERALR